MGGDLEIKWKLCSHWLQVITWFQKVEKSPSFGEKRLIEAVNGSIFALTNFSKSRSVVDNKVVYT